MEIKPKRKIGIIEWFWIFILWIIKVIILLYLGIFLLAVFTVLRFIEDKKNIVITNNVFCHKLFRYYLFKLMYTFHLTSGKYVKWLFAIDYMTK